MATRLGTREEQFAALRLLLDYGSHGAIGAEDAEKISRPFGFVAHTHKEKVNVAPKGVLNPSLPKGATVEVVGGWILANNIASVLGAYYEGALGRGTEFHRAIVAIAKKLDMDLESLRGA